VTIVPQAHRILRAREANETQCPAIDGIIKEADETAGEIEDKAVIDAASRRRSGIAGQRLHMGDELAPCSA
jgi:hypothetical protein